MSRIVLGVAGGIAAYKACEVLRRLREAGHDVEVVPTANALEFVGLATWEALAGRPVSTGVFERAYEVPHVRIGRQADLVLVVPATADLLARAATGRADDLLTNVLLTATCPVLLCPAMHTEMWHHAATTSNVAALRSRGVVVMTPATGRLTGADSGIGRLPDPDDIVAVALSLLVGGVSEHAAAQDAAGLRIAVSAGGTREALDPVRFVGNASSGRMGVALARAAALRGAEVTLVAANLAVDLPSGATIVRVTSTGDLAEAMTQAAEDADVIIMAAAPADFTPREASGTKLKKHAGEGMTLDLVQTTDVLATLAANRRPEQVIVGFAAETIADTEALIETARAKLARKGADLLVVNDVSGGKVFGEATTTVRILDTGGVLATTSGTKDAAAHAIIDAALAVRQGKRTS